MILEKINNIMDLCYAKQITREERLEKLRESISIDDFNIAINMLPCCDSLVLVRSVLLTGFLLKFYNKHNEAPLKELLLKHFHKSHEDIVRLFQLRWNNNVENITSLVQAIKFIPDYLSPDDVRYPYISNLIYAIGAQPQPESLYALEELLAETDDQEVKSMISNQLEERKSITGGGI